MFELNEKVLFRGSAYYVSGRCYGIRRDDFRESGLSYDLRRDYHSFYADYVNVPQRDISPLVEKANRLDVIDITQHLKGR